MFFHHSPLQVAAAALAVTVLAAPVESTDVDTANVTETLQARSPNSCYATKETVYRKYDIWAENFHDIAGKCGGLWDNLNGWNGCAATQTYCGGIESTHILNWHFRVPIGCDPGIIESVWWEATRNEFGAINC